MKYLAILAKSFLIAEAAKTNVHGPSAFSLEGEVALVQAGAEAGPKELDAPHVDVPKAVDAPDFGKGVKAVQDHAVYDAPGAKLTIDEAHKAEDDAMEDAEEIVKKAEEEAKKYDKKKEEPKKEEKKKDEKKKEEPKKEDKKKEETKEEEESKKKEKKEEEPKEEPKKEEKKKEEPKEKEKKKEEPKTEEKKKEKPEKEEPKKVQLKAYSHGNPKCPCIGLSGFEGNVIAKVGEDKTAEYPADAFASCQAWDDGRHPSCKEGEEPGPGNGWCATQWCYVDPCNCDLPVPPKASGYCPDATFQGKPLWYSYATCGGKDTFTTKEIKEPDFCDDAVDSKYGKEDCRCIGYDNIPGTIKVGGKSFPADLGASCDAWDGDKKWCFVDPCTCPSAIATEESKYGAETSGHEAFISYETCGSEVITNEAAVSCAPLDTKEKCLAEKCAWNGATCVTERILATCGASKDFPWNTFDEFLPSCKASLRETVETVERAYTHEQLVKALTDECAIDHKFPTVRDTFFDRRKECYKFAQQLEEARKAEMAGDKGAYDSCCKVIFAEKGPGGPATAKEKEKAEPAPAEKSGSAFAPVAMAWALVVAMLSW